MNPFLTLITVGSVALVAAAAALTPTQPSATLDATDYEIDPVHSAVLFKCKHLGTSWAFGTFDEFSGSIKLDDKDPAKSSVSVTVKTASVDTNSKDRDGHLMSPDFFDAKQFPTATFKSTAVKKSGEHAFSVTGDLTVHGVKKSVSFDMQHVGSAEDPRMGSITGFYGELVIKRADFGMNYGADTLGADVTLMLSIEAGKKK